MKLDGKQKRIAAAIAAGGVLALIVLLSRLNSGDAGAPESGLSAVADPGPSSFADNGAAMGQLSTAVSDLAGRFDLGVATLQQGQLTGDDLAAAISSGVLTGLGSINFEAPYDPPAPAEAPAQLPQVGQPAAPRKRPSNVRATVQAQPQPTAAQARAAAKPRVSFQTEGKRAGLNFKTVVKRGNVYRFYESRPGRGNYGAGGKVYVRKASKH